jgi:SWI/SNF-related matrix-associated actin-dependent regulator of chromatin subfamily A member 5
LETKNLELVSKFHRILRPFMLRRTKAEVEQHLPPKREIHLFVTLTPMQVELYRKILIEEPLGDKFSKSYAQNKLMQLRKACLHPYMFPEMEDSSLPALGEHIIDVSGKMKVLDMFLAKLLAERH